MKYLIAIASLWAGFSWAGILETTGKVVTTIDEVPVKEQAKSSLFSMPLLLTGSGKRVKKIVFVKLNVYVAAHYLDPTVKLTATDPMAGIRSAKAKAIQLTFLRDVDSGKIRNSFTDALKKNSVDMESPVMKLAMSKLTFDMKEKQTLTLVGVQKDANTEVLHFESPSGTFSVEGPGVASQFWQIWFGEPEDGGLEKLKTALIGTATNS